MVVRRWTEPPKPPGRGASAVIRTAAEAVGRWQEATASSSANYCLQMHSPHGFATYCL